MAKPPTYPYMDKTKAAIEVFDKAAVQYQAKFMDVRLYSTSLDLFCAAVGSVRAEVLEVGCGPGNITRYLLQQRPDFRILGTDLAPRMLELAKANNPAAVFQLLDCRDIGSLTASFDAIVCGFCLPYLSRAEALRFIGEAAQRLRPGGVLYISTMEGDYSKSGYQQPSSGGKAVLYIHYHQADYLTAALQENGFELLDLQRVEYAGQHGAVTRDLLLLARKR